MRTVTLPEPHRTEIKRAAERLTSPYDDIDRFVLDAFRIVAAELPRDVLDGLRAFRLDPHEYGALLLRNFPLDDDIPRTPIDGRRADKPTYVSEASLLGTAALLGEPIGFRDERDGDVVQMLAPIRQEARATSSESSEIDLAFHTDFSFNPDEPEQPLTHAKPDYIILFCLRGASEGGDTIYADVRDICRQLSAEERAVLREPLFQFSVSYSFANKHLDRPWSIPSPVLTGPEVSPEISVDLLCGSRGLTDEARRALDALRRACVRPEVARRVRLEPGDLLVIDNRKGAHARSSFRAAFDGSDRWLHRVYVRRSVWELRGQLRRGLRVF
jgi:L-asparagine oxygenase